MDLSVQHSHRITKINVKRSEGPWRILGFNEHMLFLSTGAPLYALSRFKLISNKFRFSTLLLWVVEGGGVAGGNVDRGGKVNITSRDP